MMGSQNGSNGDGRSASIRDQLRMLILARAEAPSVRKANELGDRIQSFVLEIRDSAAGRQAIEGLLSDPSPVVRLAVAIRALKWNPKRATPVLQDLARRDKGMPGFEAGVALREHKAGRLNLDWVPNRKPAGTSRRSGGQPSAGQLDAVELVHSATMSGGFLNALTAAGPSFADAAAGLVAIGLLDAAALLREAVALLPGPLSSDHDQRASLVDGLADDVAAQLEALSDRYQGLFPSDTILSDAIEARSGDSKD